MSGPVSRPASDRYLDGLLVEVDALAAAVASTGADDQARLGRDRLADAVAATLRLDGADPAELPDPDRARALVHEHTQPPHAAQPDTAQPDTAPPDATAPRRDPPPGTWLDAFGVTHETPDELLRAHEVLGAIAGLTADELAPRLVGNGAGAALRELYGRLTTGLVAAERAGAPRAFAQAVHDASTGRVIYLTAEPDAVAGELARLEAWLDSDAPALHPVVASGILHVELLRIHPFDAANGRLARTAARLVLRAGGADPHGLAVTEPVLAADPMGYHEAVADTIRRRDPLRWVARWAEAVAAGLRSSARALGVLDVAVPDRAAAFVDGRSDVAFTLADYLAEVDGDRAAADAELRALLDAGRVERMLGSHGLRFVRLP